MFYRIQNFGIPKDVVVRGVKHFISRNVALDTDDAEFALEASKLQNVEVTELFEKINYFELLKIAKDKLGIEIKGNIRKNELIKLIKQNQ